MPPLPVGVEPGLWTLHLPDHPCDLAGYLSVRPDHAAQVCARFGARDISAAVIGTATDTPRVDLTDTTGTATFWDYRDRPYLGLSKERAHA